MKVRSVVRGAVPGLALATILGLAGQALAQQATSGNTGCYSSGPGYDAARNACGEGGAPSGPVGPSAVQGQNNVINAPGCYSGAGGQAASNACGEGGAPAGPVGPSAVSAPTKVITAAPGCYSGSDSQAANNACGEGGAPRGPVGPSAVQR